MDFNGNPFSPIDGTAISPSSVDTGALTAVTITSNSITANTVTASTIVANAGIDAGGFSTFDSISFVAAQKLATPLGAVEYILPTAAPPNDGLNYVLGNVANGTSITTPAANANFAFDLRLGVGTPAQQVITFPQNVQLSAEYVYGLINDTIAEWFKSQGLPTSISFVLLVGSYPYFNQILFTDSVASIRIVVNGTTAMSILLGYNGTTPFITTTTTQGFPTAFTNLGPPNPQLVFKREVGSGFQNLSYRIQNSDNTISVDCQAAAVAVVGDMASSGSYTGTSLLLDQSVVVGVPPVGFGLLYTDPTDRINVASQAFPTQQIAYLTDIPAAYDKIQAPDSNATMICQNGGISVIYNDLLSSSVFSSSVPADTTAVLSPLNGQYLAVHDLAPLEIHSNGDVEMVCPGAWKVNSYYLPTAIGLANQVLTSDGASTASWQDVKIGLFSQTTPQTVANTTAKTTLINLASAVGSTTVNAGYFNLGSTLLYSMTGSAVRTNGVLQTLRLRFEIAGGITLCDTGIRTMPNTATPVAWTLTVQAMWNGAQLVSNLVFSFGNGGAGFVAAGAAVINTAVSNQFTISAQWGAASANNTITASGLTIGPLYR